MTTFSARMDSKFARANRRDTTNVVLKSIRMTTTGLTIDGGTITGVLFYLPSGGDRVGYGYRLTDGF